MTGRHVPAAQVAFPGAAEQEEEERIFARAGSPPDLFITEAANGGRGGAR
jgi:hypothetical protein